MGWDFRFHADWDSHHLNCARECLHFDCDFRAEFGFAVLEFLQFQVFQVYLFVLYLRRQR